MNLAKRLHSFWKVAPIVMALALLKDAVQWMGWDFIPLDGLIPSLIAGTIAKPSGCRPKFAPLWSRSTTMW